jgi:hypothetical protein
MRMPSRTWTLAACALLLVSCAPPAIQELGESQENDAAEREQWHRYVGVLTTRNDADALLAAALIEYAELERSQPALALLARAIELEPGRPDLAWIDLQLCEEVESCDARSRAERLRAIDPANAAGWYSDLRRAREAHEPLAEDEALAGMASASRFNIHYNPTILRLVETLHAPDPATGRPLRTSAAAIDDAIGWIAYLAIPTFRAISDSCKDDRLRRDEILRRCRSVIGVLEAGDTYIAEAIGFAIGRRVWPEGSPERDAIENRRRRSEYHREISRRFLPGALIEEQAAAWLRLLRSHEREQDAFATLIRDNGGSVEPPADWKRAGATN